MKRCPACRDVIMLIFTDSDTALEIDTCPECFGVWFDKEELKLFFQSPNLSARILDDSALGQDLTPAREPAAVRACPRCQSSLFPSHIGRTQLDYCLGCQGIWFDYREIQEIVAAYTSGERGNLLIVNQLAEGLGTASRPNPSARDFLQTLERYEAQVPNSESY